MSSRESSEASLSHYQMADSLQWLSYALILVFLAQVIAALFPIALFQAEWMVRFSGSIRSIASLPLIALGLIMLANMIDDKVMPSSSHLKVFRRIASLVAIGFLLLIPLQTYGAVTGIRSQLQQGQAQLGSLVSATNLVQKASNEQQLREAIGAIPGAEELAYRPLGADVPTVKKALLDRLSESTNRLQEQLNDSRSKTLQNLIGPLFRDAIICLAYAIGFAGMGYGRNGNSSLLRRLLNVNKPSISKGRQLWGAERP
jgi:hypothetical protein